MCYKQFEIILIIIFNIIIIIDIITKQFDGLFNWTEYPLLNQSMKMSVPPLRYLHQWLFYNETFSFFVLNPNNSS